MRTEIDVAACVSRYWPESSARLFSFSNWLEELKTRSDLLKVTVPTIVENALRWNDGSFDATTGAIARPKLKATTETENCGPPLLSSEKADVMGSLDFWLITRTPSTASMVSLRRACAIQQPPAG